MSRILSSVFLLLLSPAFVFAQAPDAAALTGLLNEFLAGAGRNDPSVHERFWAEDLIYTGSSGRRVGKADIVRDVRSAPAPKAGDPVTVYTAEEVRIQQYGDTAVVAFRLVGTTTRGGATEVSKFLNTGTFLRRGGRWQAVSWQATRLPGAEEEVRKEVAAAEAAFHQEELGSGRLKFTRLETSGVTVDVYGDAAVVRGKSLRQRSAVPGAGADAAPFEFFYTLTLVNKGGAWKAVAMHSSHP
ncbi:MAG: nuclear transport factor 2 family protein [Acidobacteria bacterium]|nr:nuclear transport factor 2 family protein [Acidobacteriota bacterium]MCA1621526.1 nuclear transport factor 2 family protein [Acidobacteriota bacterium]